MGSISRVVALFSGLLLLAGSALGDTVTFKLTGAGPENLGGAYVAPYTGALSVNGGAYGQSFTVVCDDYNHDVYVGQTWNVNISSMAGDLSNTRFGTSGDTGYLEAAYLITQMNFSPGSSNADLQYAIWSLFDPNVDVNALGTTHANAINADLLAASQNYQTVDASLFSIITPVGQGGISNETGTPNGSAQEYITMRTSVPEPSMFLLFGTGALGIVIRKFWR